MKINSNRWNRIRYTLWAPLYDRIVHFGAQRRRSIDLLELKRGERLLIVGGGTGADFPFIPDGMEVVAGDITPAMVERMQSRARQLGRNITTDVMDGQKLPIPDASFDAVVLHLILAVIPDPTACLREVARVLRPGGRAVVFDKFVPDEQSPSLARRGLNVLTAALFSSITRRLAPLVQATDLEIIHREPAALGGRFEIALLQKSAVLEETAPNS